MSHPFYKLDITKDYVNLPRQHKKDIYIMQSFVDNGFKNNNLKALNFVCKFIKFVTLADIATVDGNCISYQSFEAVESNGLCKDLGW